jgi:hypothetical protein
VSLSSLCNTTATVDRESITATAGGGHSIGAIATLFTLDTCTIQPASGDLIERFERRQMRISHVLYTPTALSGISARCRVTSNGITYRVVWWADQAGRGRVFALYLLQES